LFEEITNEIEEIKGEYNMYHKIIGGKKSKGQRNIKKVLNIY
jgi:hypothetical protein